jgi:hypothetical protein
MNGILVMTMGLKRAVVVDMLFWDIQCASGIFTLNYLTIKIDSTDDGFLAFWRASYGFVLELVEIYFSCNI